MRSLVAKCNEKMHGIALVLILLLGSYLCLAFFYGVSPINGSDNYLYSQYAYMLEAHGLHSIAGLGVLSVQFILIAGIAFFFKLLGPSMFSNAIFDILAFLATIVIIYIMGSELHSKRAGLIAALLYSFLPVAVIEASNSGDDIAVGLFAALAVLFMVLGMKREKQRRVLYFLSGFVAVIGVLTNGIEITILAFILPYLLFFAVKDRKKGGLKGFYALLAGILVAAMAIVIIGYVGFQKPLYVYEQASSSYNGCWGTCESLLSTDVLTQYFHILFPYAIFSQLSSAQSQASPGWLASALNNIFNIQTGLTDAKLEIGLYFYFALLLALVLFYLGDRRMIVPALWIIATVLYLSFGTRSLVSYVKINTVYPRFALLFFPAAVLLIAFGLADIFELADARRSRKKKITYYACSLAANASLAIVILVLFTQSLYAIQYLNYSWYAKVYPLLEVGAFIDALPNNATVGWSEGIPVWVYTGYRYTPYNLNEQNFNCTQIPENSYVVISTNNTRWQSACGLTRVFGPVAVPQYLSKYNYCGGTCFYDFSNLTVYYRARNSV
jgi:4-amino-4-deoxy-L-arabinose transferase-like glycosyltransferase